MGFGHNDPWMDCTYHLNKYGVTSNITMTAKVCDRESRQDLWFKNHLDCWVMLDCFPYKWNHSTIHKANFSKGRGHSPEIQNAHHGITWLINVWLFCLMHPTLFIFLYWLMLIPFSGCVYLAGSVIQHLKREQSDLWKDIDIGLNADEEKCVQLAGLMHDLGKKYHN